MAQHFTVGGYPNPDPHYISPEEESRIMEPISLDQFVAGERLRLDKFERMWREEHASMGHEYPMVMHLGEWDEQLQIFDAE